MPIVDEFATVQYESVSSELRDRRLVSVVSMLERSHAANDADPERSDERRSSVPDNLSIIAIQQLPDRLRRRSMVIVVVLRKRDDNTYAIDRDVTCIRRTSVSSVDGGEQLPGRLHYKRMVYMLDNMRRGDANEDRSSAGDERWIGVSGIESTM